MLFSVERRLSTNNKFYLFSDEFRTTTTPKYALMHLLIPKEDPCVEIGETGNNELRVHCSCDESSVTVSCDGTCDTCLDSSCGKYSSVVVLNPDVDEPAVSVRSCYDIDGGQAFCFV